MSRRTEHSQQALYTGSMLLYLRSPVTDGAGKDPGLQSLQKEQILPTFEGICCESIITEVLGTVTIIVFRQENQSSDSCAHTILTLGKESFFLSLLLVFGLSDTTDREREGGKEQQKDQLLIFMDRDVS